RTKNTTVQSTKSKRNATTRTGCEWDFGNGYEDPRECATDKSRQQRHFGQYISAARDTPRFNSGGLQAISGHSQFPLSRGDKFLPPNGHILGGLDPQADLVAPDLHDSHFDAAADHDGFFFMAADYEHDCPP